MANYDLNNSSGRGNNSWDSQNGIGKGNLTEPQIRQIIRDELMQNAKSGTPIIPVHRHDGNDVIKVNQKDILPSIGAMGKVLFIRNTTYTLNFTTANPKMILFNGFALNNIVPASSTIYGFITGNAVLPPTYYFQPVTTSTVQTGGIPYPINGQPAQCSSCIVVDSNTLANATPHVDQFNLIACSTGSGLVAQGTIINQTNTSVQIKIVLTAGWSISGNFTII